MRNGASAPFSLMLWRTSRFEIRLDRTQVMGIVNLTPDSFSDGGALATVAEAVSRCERLLDDGADILDLGAESTRPGAPRVAEDEEWARLSPVLAQAVRLGVPVSVDTRKPAVMRRALEAGADIVNDVAALQEPGALAVVAAHAGCGLCVMHMPGDPTTMQRDPRYGDVVVEVGTFLRARVDACRAAGIADDRIVVDPGIGFGKTPEHNLTLLRRQADVRSVAGGRPLLAGWSRKSTLGWVTGRPPSERLAASVAAALAAASLGARIVRVHDVAATRDALRLWEAAGLLPTDNPSGLADRIGEGRG
jgi:dihydropteroate synthase